MGNNLNRIFVIASGTAYAAGTTIYKYTDQTLGANAVSKPEKSPLQVTLLKNPVKDDLKFSINFKTDDNLLIELYDGNGRFIKQLSRDIIKTTGMQKQYNFLVTDLASGAYYLDFHNNSGRQTVNFIKQ